MDSNPDRKNSLVAPGYHDLLSNAQDINDLGIITGRALDPVTGERPTFVASPRIAKSAKRLRR